MPHEIPPGVTVYDDGTPVGFFTSIDFKDNLDVTASGGVAEVDGGAGGGGASDAVDLDVDDTNFTIIVGDNQQLVDDSIDDTLQDHDDRIVDAEAALGAAFIVTALTSDLANEVQVGDIILAPATVGTYTAGIAGRIFTATDTGLTYRDNGASFVALATPPASAIEFDPTGLAVLTGDDVQEALEEVDAALDDTVDISSIPTPTAIDLDDTMLVLEDGVLVQATRSQWLGTAAAAGGNLDSDDEFIMLANGTVVRATRSQAFAAASAASAVDSNDTILMLEDDVLVRATPSQMANAAATASALDSDDTYLMLEDGTLKQASAAQVKAQLSILDVRQYERADNGATWNKPANVTVATITCIGAGGGGQGGYRNAAGNDRDGGAGGGPGGVVTVDVLAANLPSSATITVGAGGTGGAARSTNGDGNNATNGGSSSFGSLVTAGGGTGGLHALGLHIPGTAGASSLVVGSSGGRGDLDGALSQGGGGSGHTGAGGGGASLEADNTTIVAGPGGNGAAGAGGAAGSGAGNPGAAGAAGVGSIGGSGGGGGAPAGTGGAGGLPGGAGGGGGAGNSTAPTNSGAGGDGAHGRVIVISYG